MEDIQLQNEITVFKINPFIYINCKYPPYTEEMSSHDVNFTNESLLKSDVLSVTVLYHIFLFTHACFLCGVFVLQKIQLFTENSVWYIVNIFEDY